MLEAYYSIDYTDSFEDMFGNLYIGQHSTSNHNAFLVLRLNFSEVNSKIGAIIRLQHSPESVVEASILLSVCCGLYEHIKNTGKFLH